jgi:hypothetical protein
MAVGGDYSPLDAPREGLFTYLEGCEVEQHRRTYTNEAGYRVSESLTQVYDHASQILHWTGYRRWMQGGAERVKVTRSSVRFTLPQELLSLLFYNGFEVTRQFGDWDLQPLDGGSPSIIVVCRKRLWWPRKPVRIEHESHARPYRRPLGSVPFLSAREPADS